MRRTVLLQIRLSMNDKDVGRPRHEKVRAAVGFALQVLTILEAATAAGEAGPQAQPWVMPAEPVHCAVAAP